MTLFIVAPGPTTGRAHPAGRMLKAAGLITGLTLTLTLAALAGPVQAQAPAESQSAAAAPAAGHDHGMAMSGGAAAAKDSEEVEPDAFETLGSPADVAFIGRLLLVEGHMRVARQLYQAGNAKAALPHFAHPIEEIEPFLAPQLVARKLPPLKPLLEKLVALTKAGRPWAEVQTAYDTTLKALGAIMAQPGAAVSDPVVISGVLQGVLQQAADEYRDSFVEERIGNVVEYQDAKGFVAMAAEWLDYGAAALRAVNEDATPRLIVLVANLQPVFEAIDPPAQPVLTEAQFRRRVREAAVLLDAVRS